MKWRSKNAIETVSLPKAVLCADCEHISESHTDSCPVCGSTSVVNLARLLTTTVMKTDVPVEMQIRDPFIKRELQSLVYSSDREDRFSNNWYQAHLYPGGAPVQLMEALDFCAAEWPHHGVSRNFITTEPSRSRSQPLTRVIAGAIGQELHKPSLFSTHISFLKMGRRAL